MRSSSGSLIACAILSLNLLSFINASPALKFNALEPRRGVRVPSVRGSTGGHTSSDDDVKPTSGSSEDTNTGSGSADRDTSSGSSGTNTGASGSTLTGSGTSYSSPYFFVYSGTYQPGLVRGQCQLPDGKCYLQDSTTGNRMTCNGVGLWYTITASNISAACAQFKYTPVQYSQGQHYVQTTTDAGLPLLNQQGGPMTMNWTTQFDQAEFATPAACEGALGDLVTACAATNGSSQGGLFEFPNSSAAYGLAFT